MPVSSLINGHYGVNDMCLGVPTILGAEGIEEILDIDLDENETISFNKSAEALKAVLDKIQL